jgi:hypothetical protein
LSKLVIAKIDRLLCNKNRSRRQSITTNAGQVFQKDKNRQLKIHQKEEEISLCGITSVPFHCEETAPEKLSTSFWNF